MLKKLLVALVASAFALGAYAQAPKAAEPKADTKTEARKDGDKKPAKKAKSTKSTKATKKTSDAKDGRKDAPKEPKKEAK